MNGPTRPTAAENPFSTSRIRPGAIPYVFPPEENADRLVERLQQNGWWGQIVGGHGSGKSALLATLIPAIERAAGQILLIELHDGARRLPVDLRRLLGLKAGAVVIVDGYEQLAHWSRWRLKRDCRQRRLGLLVTAHAPVGLPELFRTSTSVELAHAIVDRLLEAGRSRIPADELQHLFAVHGGDLRELLFALYDQHEQQQ